MTNYHSLIVLHSEDELTAVYDLGNGEQYSARFSTGSHLLKALAKAGTSIIRDNHLIKCQLRLRQNVVTDVHITTTERLVNAGFVKDPIAA